MNISMSDFVFIPHGYGHYKVGYKGKRTWKGMPMIYWCVTSDMQLIDATKNADTPRFKDLNKLKKLCKQSSIT